MAHINRQAIVKYSDKQMYALVNDVAAYPDYLPGCDHVDVLASTQEQMRARLHLSKKGIQLAFTTRNVLDAPKSIVLHLEDGPFAQFEGRWFFQHLNDSACKVILDLQFQLANKITGLAAGRLFDSVANNLVDAMVARAKKVYG